ncbi:DMT family transporter [Corynebacterium sp. CCM 9185]|uniref:DMT family transporter n=1 Tax=Corynebacterium marambiense TaxID=2765364 RepID=A0ABS0VS99_9CORY|nr:DMT family transporter [Corynebacterium marambiense]MCK7662489.1 DMT family transporter [Corynebacterium marambiense]
MQSNVIAVVFALASALTIAWGTVIRHRIAEEAPGDGTSLRSAPIVAVIGRPLWWVGTFAALLGYALQIAALGFGTLLVVQPVLVLSLMFTFPMSAVYDGRRISKAETFWSLILTAAVAVLVILGRPSPGLLEPPLNRWLPALAVGGALLFCLDRLAYTRIRRQKALLLGMVTGGVMGYVAVLSKAFVDILVHQGFTGILLSWESYALLGGAVLGTAVQQSSFNAGALRQSLPAMTVTEPIFAFVLGYAVLGEKFSVSGLSWTWMALALLAMIISTFLLSRRGVG